MTSCTFTSPFGPNLKIWEMGIEGKEIQYVRDVGVWGRKQRVEEQGR